MKQDTYIISNWTAEVNQQKEQQKLDKITRYTYLKEFRESFCDLFDLRDFYYYAEMIGCNVAYLLNCAKYTTDPEYKRYNQRQRDLPFRRQFYIENGHSITKPFIWPQ